MIVSRFPQWAVRTSNSHSVNIFSYFAPTTEVRMKNKNILKRYTRKLNKAVGAISASRLFFLADEHHHSSLRVFIFMFEVMFFRKENHCFSTENLRISGSLVCQRTDFSLSQLFLPFFLTVEHFLGTILSKIVQTQTWRHFFFHFALTSNDCFYATKSTIFCQQFNLHRHFTQQATAKVTTGDPKLWKTTSNYPEKSTPICTK